MRKMNYLIKLTCCLLFALSVNQTYAQFDTSLPKPAQADLSNSQTLNITDIKKSGHIQVTSANYDNIGQILTKIDFKYESYAPQKSPYMIFMNCGTSTYVDPTEIRTYVQGGGILYASDLSDEVLVKAFPGVFDFEGRIGTVQEMTASIEDYDLKEVLGEDMDVHFDLKNWAVLNGISEGKVLIRSTSTGKPLMVEVPYGDGRIFYTCFHNHKQASEKEEALLKLLIAKQVNSLLQQDFASTAEEMGLDLNKMKIMFKK